MRISRRKKKPQPIIPHFEINEKIQAEEIRLIDEEAGTNELITTRAAITKAREEQMDLVIINPKASPPIAKIVDFTHFKYQKEKESRKQKANAHVTEIKGVRLSVRIGKGDLAVRKMQAERFLNRGDKVKAEIILRGRERGKLDVAFGVIKTFFELLSVENSIKYEQNPERQGNKVTAIITKK
jgi:translation initiation factor IF-3